MAPWGWGPNWPPPHRNPPSWSPGKQPREGRGRPSRRALQPALHPGGARLGKEPTDTPRLTPATARGPRTWWAGISRTPDARRALPRARAAASPPPPGSRRHRAHLPPLLPLRPPPVCPRRLCVRAGCGRDPAVRAGTAARQQAPPTGGRAQPGAAGRGGRRWEARPGAPRNPVPHAGGLCSRPARFSLGMLNRTNIPHVHMACKGVAGHPWNRSRK